MIRPRSLSPLLRWAGGKRWLSSGIRDVANFVGCQSYLEPFLGGGAVFFGSDWPAACIGDINPRLIRCYLGIANDPMEVRRSLGRLTVDRATYDQIRHWDPKNMTDFAVRLLYLNRTSYAGIYRENALGIFNVPFGGDRTLQSVLKETRLEGAAAALTKARMVEGDFEGVLCQADGASLIYCDPPYSLQGAERGFRRYTRSPFEWRDQLRLAARLEELAYFGNTIVMSNAVDETVRNLYPSAQVLPLVRRTTLARGSTSEQKEGLYVIHRDCSLADQILHVLQKSLRRL